MPRDMSIPCAECGENSYLYENTKQGATVFVCSKCGALSNIFFTTTRSKDGVRVDAEVKSVPPPSVFYHPFYAEIAREWATKKVKNPA